MFRLRLVAFLALGLATLAFPLHESSAGGRGRANVCCNPCEVVCCPPPICCQPIIIVQQTGGGQQQAKVDPNSAKVNLVLVLDTEDEGIGRDAASEGKLIELLWFSLPRADRGNFVFVQGKELNRKNLLDAIREIPVGPNETLLVYCNVHGSQTPGTYDEQSMNMYRAPGVAGETIGRRDVEDAIKAKTPKLGLLITDSCFQTIADENADPDEQTLSSGSRAAKFDPVRDRDVTDFNPDDLDQVLRRLMIGHRGFVSINSSSPKQFAFGDVFTPTFNTLCKKGVSAGDISVNTTWEDFFKQLQKRTEAKFKSAKAKAAKRPDSKMTKQDTQVPIAFIDQRFMDKWPQPIDRLDRPQAESSGGGEGGGQAAAAAAVPAPATITVRLPADAKLTVDGAPTSTGTAERLLRSPPLEPGREFSYILQAETVRNGTTYTSTRKVPVRAGQPSAVDFGDLSDGVARAPDAPAEVTVKLPADAKLFVDGQPYAETGAVRRIQSPPLPAEKPFVYTLRAEWQQDGQARAETRQVDVAAGKKVEVDFTRPAPSAAARR
jgi:uncharacterized protein (TIGR03000 family)